MAMSGHDGHGLPCGFSLLPDKRQDTYELMINRIVEKVGQTRHVDTVICDFEKSMMNALGAILSPEVNIRGCAFHFRKAIWRNIGLCGLQAFFYGEQIFNELVYKVYALNLIPPKDLARLYQEQIVDTICSKREDDEEWREGHDELESFMDYLDTTWIGKPIRGRPGARRKPMFEYRFWNQYQAYSEQDDGEVVSTNNCLESWNRTWNGLMGIKPNFFKVIQGFISQESETKRLLVTQATGRDMSDNSGRRSICRDHRERLKNIISQYATMPNEEFLTTLAHEIASKY